MARWTIDKRVGSDDTYIYLACTIYVWFSEEDPPQARVTIRKTHFVRSLNIILLNEAKYTVCNLRSLTNCSLTDLWSNQQIYSY